MSSTSETGHAKNVSNMSVLIASCVANTDRYKPSNKNLVLEALNALYTKTDQAVTAVNTMAPANTKAIAARKIVFKPLSKLVTRLYNAAVSSGASKEVVASIATIKRLIQGTRATPKLSDEKKAALKAAGKEKKESSSSQVSFDQRINNMDKLIKLLAALPEYTPNEVDLQITSLQALLATLQKTNKDVVDTDNLLYKARTTRDLLMNAEKTGLIDICLDTKAYIKSVDSSDGRWYKQISGLKFVRPKN